MAPETNGTTKKTPTMHSIDTILNRSAKIWDRKAR